MGIRDVISDFSSWFDSRLKTLDEIHDDDVKMLVLCSLLDSLASCVYFHKTGFDRFSDILEHHSNDITWTRISAFCVTKDKRYSRLKENAEIEKYFNDRLSWIEQKRSFTECEVDPYFLDIEKTFAGSKNLEALHELCFQYKYSNIFYKRYRKNLVRESKILSELNVLSQDIDKPYYVCRAGINEKSVYKLHLVFPLNFILATVRSIIRDLNDFFLKEDINPYSRFK